MFSTLSSLTKAAVGAVVATPVAVVADALTLGGVNTGRDQSYTSQALSNVLENISDATDPKK